MVDSLIEVRLPAIVWLASTAIVIAHRGRAPAGAVLPVAWLVFLPGIAYFPWRVSRPARER